MSFEQLAHDFLSLRNGNPVDASFHARPKIMRLKSILSTKLASSVGDCKQVSKFEHHGGICNALSSCKLSINACFWLCVMRIFFIGRPVGVVTSSAPVISGDLRFIAVDMA